MSWSARSWKRGGGLAGYQHWWLSNLRSNLSYGYWQASPSSQLLGPVESTVANNRLQAVNFNLIWSPVAFVDTGVEYIWGQRRVVANITGQEQLLMGEFRIKFQRSLSPPKPEVIGCHVETGGAGAVGTAAPPNSSPVNAFTLARASGILQMIYPVLQDIAYYEVRCSDRVGGYRLGGSGGARRSPGRKRRPTH